MYLAQCTSLPFNCSYEKIETEFALQSLERRSNARHVLSYDHTIIIFRYLATVHLQVVSYVIDLAF